MIIGHKNQWEYLVRSFQKGRIPQVMIFSGEEHLGKRKAAVEFFKFLNCENIQKQENDFPCQKCSNCLGIEKFSHPDFYFLDSFKKEIQIEKIRDLKIYLATTPFKNAFKAVLINDAHKLNQESQNCLLKTLEEPKGKVLIILISHKSDFLLPTIKSRAQILNFYPLFSFEIEEGLKMMFSSPLLKKISNFCEGKPGLAISFLENPEKFELEIKRHEFIRKFFEEDVEERIILVQKIIGKEDFPENLSDFLRVAAKYLRSVILKKAGISQENAGFSNSSLKLENYSFKKIKENIQNVENLKNLISWANINPKLALENLILSL